MSSLHPLVCKEFIDGGAPSSLRRRVQEVDPNGGRCLVENRAEPVELVHVFPRELSTDLKLMESLEWHWNLRKGSLNLDTRRNVFYLSPALAKLYREDKWALIPEKSIVLRYFGDPNGIFGDCVQPRHRFPEVEEPTFRYNLLPLSYDMEHITITRQTDTTSTSTKRF